MSQRSTKVFGRPGREGEYEASVLPRLRARRDDPRARTVVPAVGTTVRMRFLEPARPAVL
ncbi:hypothetical protein [Haladaptatus sp. DFWS20]|uniref:hypothetical protein n=1 Tax=Haladaptatus sp. DFWS20 TaxID=3403467 RepID=UPI003EBBCAD3